MTLLTYCWWTKSCTTKDDDYPIIYRVLTIPGGAGFCPSTVWQQRHVWCCLMSKHVILTRTVYIHNAGWIIISQQQRLKSLEPIQLLAHGTCYRRREKFSDSRGFDTDRMAGGPRGPWLKGKHTNPGNWSNLKQFTHENLSAFLSAFSFCRGLASDFATWRVQNVLLASSWLLERNGWTCVAHGLTLVKV